MGRGGDRQTAPGGLSTLCCDLVGHEIEREAGVSGRARIRTEDLPRVRRLLSPLSYAPEGGEPVEGV